MKYPPHTEASEILQETRGFNIIFIHSSLDDAGLTPQEFRLFAHLSRRAGSGEAWAGAASMATACRMHPDTVWSALKELERRKMVLRENRPGRTTLIRLTKPSDWNLQPTGLEGRPLKPGDGNGGVTPTPQNRVAPTGLEGHEGNPLNVSKESNPLSESDGEAQEIYDAYPRKAARPVALRAIKKALKLIKAPRLLELTRQFGAATKHCDQNYIPHPATWFNQERYNDNPSTWVNKPSTATSAKPTYKTHDLVARDFAL